MIRPDIEEAKRLSDSNPKDPSGREWVRACRAQGVPNGVVWQLGGLCVISALEVAPLPGGTCDDDVGPQWHISITDRGRRPKPHHIRKVLRAFGMVGAELDNHHPGNAQHFWMPVDPARRGICECKAEEVAVIEPDGYTWQNDLHNCRGCELARLFGKPCALH